MPCAVQLLAWQQAIQKRLLVALLLTRRKLLWKKQILIVSKLTDLSLLCCVRSRLNYEVDMQLFPYKECRTVLGSSLRLHPCGQFYPLLEQGQRYKGKVSSSLDVTVSTNKVKCNHLSN